MKKQHQLTLDSSKPTKGEKTKARLLESAIHCFAAEGWEGASISELSRRSNANRASYIQHFGSKEAFVEECMEYAWEQFRAATLRFLQDAPTESNWLEKYYFATFKWLKEFPEYAAFLFLIIQRGAYDPRARRFIDGKFREAWGVVAARMQGDPEINRRVSGDCYELAQKIHAILVGGITSALIDTKRDFQGFERRCLETAKCLLGFPK